MEPTERDLMNGEICECEPDCNYGCCENDGASFEYLFADFIAGTPIKRKAWRGYWKYKYGEIEMHCKDGTVTKFSETKDILFTIAGILQDDWEYATPANCDVPLN